MDSDELFEEFEEVKRARSLSSIFDKEDQVLEVDAAQADETLAVRLMRQHTKHGTAVLYAYPVKPSCCLALLGKSKKAIRTALCFALEVLLVKQLGKKAAAVLVKSLLVHCHLAVFINTCNSLSGIGFCTSKGQRLPRVCILQPSIDCCVVLQLVNCGLSDVTIKALEARGITALFPIQKHVYEPAAAGRVTCDAHHTHWVFCNDHHTRVVSCFPHSEACL